jgi:fluoroacetyl-CoA thioesterase
LRLAGGNPSEVILLAQVPAPVYRERVTSEFPSIGDSAEATLTVSVTDTAVASRSGDVDVLGTPRLIALLEEATVAVVASALAANQTSVGVRVEVDHLAPASIGEVVDAHATLDSIDGNTLTFVASAKVGECLIGKGRITRVLTHRSRFDSGTR